MDPTSETEMTVYLKSEQARWDEVVRKLGFEGSQ